MTHQYPWVTKRLWKLEFPTWTSGSDQLFTCEFTGTPPINSSSGLYVVTGIYVPCWPGDSSATGNPTGGIFDAASGGGNAIIASTQVWNFTVGNTFVAKLNSAVCPDPYVGGNATILTAANVPRLFLATPGSGGGAAIYIYGYEVSGPF